MVVIKFGKWSSASLRWFTYKRIYTKKYKWTPFCVMKKRFKRETSIQTADEHLIDKDVMDALCYLRSKALEVAEGEVVIESFHQVHDYIKKLEFGRWEVRQGNGDPLGISEIWIDKGENGCGENLGKPYAGSWGEKT